MDINTLYCTDYENFVQDEIISVYEQLTQDDEYASVEIIAKYDDIKEIIKELIVCGYDIAFIEQLTRPDYNGYDDEFLLTLDDAGIWCELAKRDGKYIYTESDITYLFSNCSSKIIPYIQSDNVVEVSLDEEYDEFNEDIAECTCHKCQCNCKETEPKIVQSQTSNITYKVNDKEVDKETYDKALADFNKKYNEWRNLLCW